MFIKSLKLANFRSWRDYDLDFNSVTILIGKNGVGKTNILESVWFLANGRSWRVRHAEELILWGEDFARISAKLENDHKDIEIFLPAHQYIGSAGLPRDTATQYKQLKIDGIKHRFLDLLGVMPAVLFSPESIQLIDGSPGLRRKFMDVVLSQTSRQYALNLIEYGKIIRERNKLLYHIKMKRSKLDELDFWDDKLVALGVALMTDREELIKFFNINIAASYKKIAGTEEKLAIKYLPAVEREHFADILFANREREVEQAITTHGPHRDDFRIYLGDRDVATFGSRGEYRSVILSLKIVELEFLAKKRGEKPILLLDDIFSELDHDRRMHLAEIIKDQQTIITTTDLDHIEKGLREKAKIVEL